MKKFTSLVTLAVVLALSTACGSVSKTAYSGLEGLKAGYVTANGVRDAYCAPAPAPKPQICKDSYAPLNAAYHVLTEGTSLLATYITTKDAGLATQLTALVSQIPGIILQVTEIAGEFKSAKGVAPPANVPAPPSR